METSECSEATPRVAVAITVYNDGVLAKEAIASCAGGEQLEVVVIDGGSSDPETLRALDEIEAGGARVVRQQARISLAAARNQGVEQTTAPYVFPLDADDQAVPSALSILADRLDEHARVVACYGDYLEFGRSRLVRAVPERMDPFRLTLANEYPGSALFRRTFLEEVGGWRGPLGPSYQDWDLWMTIAERGDELLYAGPGFVTFRRRLEGLRMGAAARPLHSSLYEALKSEHPALFAASKSNARHSDLSRVRKLLYPLVYGGRRRFAFEAFVKRLLDRLGIWTLRR